MCYAHISVDVYTDLFVTPFNIHSQIHTLSIYLDSAAARRRFRSRIDDTSRKPTTMPTKLAEESGRVSD